MPTVAYLPFFPPPLHPKPRTDAHALLNTLNHLLIRLSYTVPEKDWLSIPRVSTFNLGCFGSHGATSCTLPVSTGSPHPSFFVAKDWQASSCVTSRMCRQGGARLATGEMRDTMACSYIMSTIHRKPLYKRGFMFAVSTVTLAVLAPAKSPTNVSATSTSCPKNSSNISVQTLISK